MAVTRRESDKGKRTHGSDEEGIGRRPTTRRSAAETF
jgi:hypothetical protein